MGSTRFTGIAGERWTYTASGAVTNIAARVCSVSKGGEILVTDATARHIESRFKLGPVREQLLKNVSRPIPVQEVMVA